jgi:hypothetical protein
VVSGQTTEAAVSVGEGSNGFGERALRGGGR